MRIKNLKILSLALALLLCLSGCGVFTLTEEEQAEIAADDAEVIVGSSGGQALVTTYAADDVFSLNSVPDASFNPYDTTSAWNQVVGMLVYETLVSTDNTFSASSNLITAWSTEDGLTWTFSVDTTRTFHDGGDMTSYDAVYSITQAMAYGSRYARRFAHVSSVSVVDSQTFTVVLNEANYRFYELLNIPCIEYGSAYEELPSGTGPYQFSEDGTCLELFEDHPLADEMPLDTIYLQEYTAAVDILQAFEDSYIDLVINNPTGMASLGYSSTNITKYVDTTNMQYLGYNMSSAVFGQTGFRVAMTYAIDRANIVSDCMQGAAVAAALPVHPNSSLYPEDIADDMAYSEEGFLTALENAGATDVDGDGALEINGQDVTITFLVCSDSAAKVSAARLIAEQLRSVGFTVTLRELNYDDFESALEEGDFDLYYGEVKICNDWDISVLVDSGGSLNYGGVSDSFLAGYLTGFLGADDSTLDQAASAYFQYLAQTAPITVVCFEKSEVLYHRGVISGLDPTQDNIFYNMQDWTIDLGTDQEDEVQETTDR
ncbi:MAG: ABC transporter substrate-binding protein [Oscillospiraceae bacterium]|nr:ABC transporter substrate-binding protein [Oscillospiraceae bacterium]